MPRKRLAVVQVEVQEAPPESSWTEWMRLEIGGAEWTVHLTGCTELERLNGDPCDGLTIAEKLAIFVDEDQPFDRQVVILVHELLHAALSCVGAGYMTALINGVEKLSGREEAYVSYVAPLLAGALRPILNVPPPRHPGDPCSPAISTNGGTRRIPRAGRASGATRAASSSRTTRSSRSTAGTRTPGGSAGSPRRR